MISYESVQVSRVMNGYIVERPWIPSDLGRQLEHTRVFNDFDDLCAHLGMVLGDPAQEQAAQAETDATRMKEGTAEEFEAHPVDRALDDV